MSIVVALKNKDGIVIASDKQVTNNGNSFDLATKITKMKYSNSVIGVVGEMRDCNIINSTEEIICWEDIVKNTEIDYKYIVNKIVPYLFDLLKKYNRVVFDKGIEYFKSQFILVINNKLFTICENGSILEHKDYVTIGCGTDMIYGYLDTISNISELTMDESTKILENLIKQSCKKDIYIGNNIDIIKLYKGELK